MFALELPYRGNFNEYTQYTISNIKKKLDLNYPKSAATGLCSKGLQKEFETAVVKEPSVFQPLKFYCILKKMFLLIKLWQTATNILGHIFHPKVLKLLYIDTFTNTHIYIYTCI